MVFKYNYHMYWDITTIFLILLVSFFILQLYSEMPQSENSIKHSYEGAVFIWKQHDKAFSGDIY